jgi:hypothetical protein
VRASLSPTERHLTRGTGAKDLRVTRILIDLRPMTCSPTDMAAIGLILAGLSVTVPISLQPSALPYIASRWRPFVSATKTA